jgi:transposase
MAMALWESLLSTQSNGRRVISDIIHVIRGGLMWRGAPDTYGSHKTMHIHFVRWSRAGVFDRIFATLAAESAASDTVMIASRRLLRNSLSGNGCRPPPSAPHLGELT